MQDRLHTHLSKPRLRGSEEGASHPDRLQLIPFQLNAVSDKGEHYDYTARKQQARAIMARRSMTYTQATKLVEDREAFDLRRFTSGYDEAVLAKAALELAAGRQVIVFGRTGSGKSTVMHSIMERLSGTPRTYVLPNRYGREIFDAKLISKLDETERGKRVYVQSFLTEPGFKTEDSSYRIIHPSTAPYLSQASLTKIVAFDELRDVEEAAAFANLSAEGHSLMFGLHSGDKAQAIFRCSHFGVVLSDPLMLNVSRSPETGKHSLTVA